MMDQELKTKWIVALTSGEYKQGTGCLKDHYGARCCLGVLAEVIGGYTIMESMDSDDREDANGSIYDDFKKMMGQKMVSELAEMNDDGYSFREIAEYIDWNVKVKE